MKRYSAKAVANEFLRIAQSEGVDIAPMKIQKLVYFAAGWALGLSGKPLIHENIQAWKYGPVINELYHEFKHFGRSPITSEATDYHLDDSHLNLTEVAPQIDSDDKDAVELIKRIWDVYGHHSDSQLSTLTHLPNTPWAKTYNGSHQKIIPNELIRQFFKEKADSAV
jgi:uncharacterized phage-associated protein